MVSSESRWSFAPLLHVQFGKIAERVSASNCSVKITDTIVFYSYIAGIFKGNPFSQLVDCFCSVATEVFFIDADDIAGNFYAFSCNQQGLFEEFQVVVSDFIIALAAEVLNAGIGFRKRACQDFCSFGMQSIRCASEFNGIGNQVVGSPCRMMSVLKT